MQDRILASMTLISLCVKQEGQKLQAEVVWQIDRVAAELAEAEREVKQLAAQAGASGAARTVADVDAELEDVENQRAALERQKESVMRRQERLRCAVGPLVHVYQTTERMSAIQQGSVSMDL